MKNSRYTPGALLVRVLLLATTAASLSSCASMQNAAGTSLPVAEKDSNEHWLKGGGDNEPAYTYTSDSKDGKAVAAPEGETPVKKKADKKKKTKAKKKKKKKSAYTDVTKPVQPANPPGKAAPPKAATGIKPTAAAAKAIAAARSYLGTPYVYGGMSRKGVDCSGLTTLAYKDAGVSLPRTSRDQGNTGKRVAKSDIKPGDLLFFATGRPGAVSHVALVVERQGDEIIFIHAATSGGVRLDKLSMDYYRTRFLWATRVLQ